MLKFISVVLMVLAWTGPVWASSNSVRFSEENGYRYIVSNGIPDRQTGQFPNSGNPNSISPQNYTFRVPLSPERSASITPL